MPLLLYELSEEETLALPLDRLASIVLQHLIDTNEWNEHNFLNAGHVRGVKKNILKSWAEGLNWLISHNLVARSTPGQTSSQAIFVTRLGHRALRDGFEPVLAAARLDVDLHPRLKSVRSQFLIGEYELAAFAAMREVEIRVRELIGASNSLLGVALMRQAFGDSGKLSDTALDGGERHGIRELFSGAIATFKNPSSHRQVNYNDPTEASEVVLFADLLMRLLDRYAERLTDIEH